MKTVHLIFEIECGYQYFVKAFERLIDAEAYVEKMNPPEGQAASMENYYIHKEVDLVQPQD